MTNFHHSSGDNIASSALNSSFKDGFARLLLARKNRSDKGIFVFIVVLSHARSYFPILGKPPQAHFIENSSTFSVG